METKNDTKEEILCITFSFNNKLFAVGTNKGFKVYTANPLSLEITRNLQGGIGLIEMLEVSNIMLLGGGGSNPSLESLDDLFADEEPSSQPVEPNMENAESEKPKQNTNAFAAPIVNEEEEARKQAELVDIQKEIEAKFDELFGSMDSEDD